MTFLARKSIGNPIFQPSGRWSKHAFPASFDRSRGGASYTDDELRDLAAIKPGEPTYVSAQYEICQLQYQRWSKAKYDAAKAERVAAELVKSVEQYLALSGGVAA